MHAIGTTLMLLLSLPLLGRMRVEGMRAENPVSRALLQELTSAPRLAGTSGSEWSANLVTRHLKAAGFTVEWDEREVLLSLPRRLELLAHEGPSDAAPFLEQVKTFDPDADPCPDVPQFNAWSAEGRVRAAVIDAGHGLRADFERLIADDISPEGHIALCRYGESYRGAKVALAAEYGCVGVLLFSDPASDGEGRGAVWPEGPWKPDWAAQRGSIKGTLAPPGDPTTPGWPSRAPGETTRRLSGAALKKALPQIPCLPIPAAIATQLQARLTPVALDGAEPAPLGPGPVEVTLDIQQPRELRTIRNVIATLPGADDSAFVLAGNHRDSWVRGAHDAGGGTVALLRAAQRLGERARSGWEPPHTICLAFWDAEETGLFGSTEWVEAHTADLRARCIAYVNMDVGVSGARFQRASGSPGLLGVLTRTLAELAPAEPSSSASLLAEWREHLSGREPRLGLVGAGSDYAAFCHHACIPVLDLGLSGASGGQYHTAFDDFLLIERFIDPGFRGHEKAGELAAALLARLADEGFSSFDEREAALDFERRIDEAAWWLGEHAERLSSLFSQLAENGASGSGSDRLYARLADESGLPRRPWFRNTLWAPAPENGYSTLAFPGLRTAADRGEEELAQAVDALAQRIERLLQDRRGNTDQ